MKEAGKGAMSICLKANEQDCWGPFARTARGIRRGGESRRTLPWALGDFVSFSGVYHTID